VARKDGRLNRFRHHSFEPRRSNSGSAESPHPIPRNRMIRAMDALNARFGRGTLFPLQSAITSGRAAAADTRKEEKSVVCGKG
jgi:hypothetical protein